MSDAGFVAVLVIELHFPDAGSLKAKRKDLSSIKALLHGRFGAAVAETGAPGSVAALDAGRVARRLVRAGARTRRSTASRRWLDERCPSGVHVERMLASVEDLRDVLSYSAAGG